MIGKGSLLVIITILLLMFITPTFAETTTSHMNEKTAMAILTSDSLHVTVVVRETIQPMKKMMLQFTAQDTSSGLLILEEKEIASYELSWSSDNCRLNTEIHGSPLLVEWKSRSPTQREHTNQKLEIEWLEEGTMRLVSMMVERHAEVRLNWNGYTLQGDGQMGRVNIKTVIHSKEELWPPSPP